MERNEPSHKPKHHHHHQATQTMRCQAQQRSSNTSVRLTFLTLLRLPLLLVVAMSSPLGRFSFAAAFLRSIHQARRAVTVRRGHVLWFRDRDHAPVHDKRMRQATTRLFQSSSNGLGAAARVTQTLPPVPPNAHRIVACRHGESEFNNANVFTGWCDVALTQRGIVEAVEAGQVFASHGLVFRKCYTSMLTRSIVTAHRALEAAGIAYTPISYDWRINERHYGALQGLSKERTAVRLGRKIVMQWRRSYTARPPLMTPEHPHYDIIQNDARYRNLEGIPLGESLVDCQVRVVEAWKDIIAEIQNDKLSSSSKTESNYSLLVAHANSLRALVQYLDDIPENEIEVLNIPTAIPFYYDIDLTTGQVINPKVPLEEKLDVIAPGRFRGVYISDERKKRSFLERRRAANDPWLWALHDHQVAKSLLVDEEAENISAEGEGMEGLEEEARHNTEIFSHALDRDSPK